MENGRAWAKGCRCLNYPFQRQSAEMLRFRLAHLLRVMEEARGENIPWRTVSDATGISVSVLSNLASPRPGTTTNTRYVDALCRFFGCTPNDLIELMPESDGVRRCHVDELYPRQP